MLIELIDLDEMMRRQLACPDAQLPADDYYCSHCGQWLDTVQLSHRCPGKPKPRQLSPPTTLPHSVLAGALNTRYGCRLTADAIVHTMVFEPGQVQVQATRDGFTDWYDMPLDDAGQPIPAGIEQLPF